MRKDEKTIYIAKDYSRLLGMEGLSDPLLKNHFTLYQGYVTNTNKLLETIGQMIKKGKAGSPEYAELKRRFGWEFNGMRLHEYYFENLGGKGGLEKTSRLTKKISEDFGSYENWEKNLKPLERCEELGGQFSIKITKLEGSSTSGLMNMMLDTLLTVGLF